jgi:choline dehydrogenase
MADISYDYIIVGAGSAGCVLASRLTEDPDIRVLLLEAGGRTNHWSVMMPAALAANFLGGPFNWSYYTVPQPRLAGRRIFQPRGKGLGGSSAINGMAYISGHALDFERWAAEGATGWSYAEVLPYFKRAETNSRGENAWRGGSGPLATIIFNIDQPLNRAFVDAGVQAGFNWTDDVNGFRQEGFGPYDKCIDRGVRASTAHAFLAPVRQRPNLTVETGAMALGIVVDGKRATGLRYAVNGAPRTAHASREVVLASGAFGSPQLLMLSGIGPADHLRRHGIEVVHDLPGVGENLQDHLEVHLQYTAPMAKSANRFARQPLKTAVGLRWLLRRDGPCASNHVEAGAFTKSDPSVAHPDIQYHFFPFLMDGWGPSRKSGGFCVCAGTLRARNRGRMTLASADPRAAPLIDPDYLDDDRDLDELRACVHQARDIVSQKAFDPYRREEQAPWAGVTTDADIDRLIRETAESAYHPCGTCKMGHDAMAVVDPECRVHGIENLRVVDSSIMPSITSGNLNAPTIMIGEKGADMILGRPPLAPSNAGWYEADV